VSARVDQGAEDRPDAAEVIEYAAGEPSRVNTPARLVVSGLVMLAVAVGLLVAAYRLGRGALALEREARERVVAAGGSGAARRGSAGEHEREVAGWLWAGAAACTAVGGLMATGAGVSLRKVAVG